MMPKGSKASNLENEDARASKPLPKQAEALEEVFSFRLRSGGDRGGREGEEARARAEERTREDLPRGEGEGDLVALVGRGSSH